MVLLVLVLLVLLVLVLLVLLLLLLPHGEGQAQVIAGVGITGVQAQRFFIGPDRPFHILSPQEQVADVVPSIRFDACILRLGGSPLKGFHGIFGLSVSRKGHAAIELQLTWRCTAPSCRRIKQAVRRGKISVEHGLRALYRLALGSGNFIALCHRL